jgi:hypothetical protein
VEALEEVIHRRFVGKVDLQLPEGPAELYPAQKCPQLGADGGGRGGHAAPPAAFVESEEPL